MKVKNCCRKSASTVDIAVCTRSISLISVESSVPVVLLLKEGRGAPQDGVVEVVAQVGDHAEARIVHQVGAGIVADGLEHGRGDERIGHDRPGIVEVRRHQPLQVQWCGASAAG